MTEENDELMQYPCDFPIKVVGLATDAFELAVLVIIRKHYTNLKENALSTRLSKDGKYMSITIDVTAESREQLDNTYIELNNSDAVIMTL